MSYILKKQKYFMKKNQEIINDSHTRDSGVTGLHFDNLFNQDEDGSGSLLDIATGKPYDNSTFLATEGLTHISDEALVEKDKHKSEDDAADAWLRNNDPEHPEYGIKSESDDSK